jgi:hypothetical protein
VEGRSAREGSGELCAFAAWIRPRRCEDVGDNGANITVFGCELGESISGDEGGVNTGDLESGGGGFTRPGEKT